jgi:hypothetical protein
MSVTEISTALPILNFNRISNQLVYFDPRPRDDITHVAVLNHTFVKYPKGAFFYY